MEEGDCERAGEAADCARFHKRAADQCLPSLSRARLLHFTSDLRATTLPDPSLYISHSCI